MSIKGSRIEIKELSAIRVFSDDSINSSEMDNVVGGHGYHGHYGYYGHKKYYDFIYKYVQSYLSAYGRGGKFYSKSAYGGGGKFY